jgi:hypothetical protein
MVDALLNIRPQQFIIVEGLKAMVNAIHIGTIMKMMTVGNVLPDTHFMDNHCVCQCSVNLSIVF